MIKVLFTFVGTRRDNETRNMPSAPREGDQIYFGLDGQGNEFTVRTVVWYLDEPDFDVYVVMR
jgi:hypothetical protein